MSEWYAGEHEPAVQDKFILNATISNFWARRKVTQGNQILTWNAAFKMSSDFAWSLSSPYILPFEGLYVTIYLSFCYTKKKTYKQTNKKEERNKKKGYIPER